MYTKLYFPRGIDSDVMRSIEDACKQAKNSSMARWGDDVLVRYSTDGVMCQFGRRLFEVPKDMRSCPPTMVRIEHPAAQCGIPGVYQRKRARAVVEQVWVYSLNGSLSRVEYKILVEGHTLRSANSLYDDILAEAVSPTKRHQPNPAT